MEVRCKYELRSQSSLVHTKRRSDTVILLRTNFPNFCRMHRRHSTRDLLRSGTTISLPCSRCRGDVDMDHGRTWYGLRAVLGMAYGRHSESCLTSLTVYNLELRLSGGEVRCRAKFTIGTRGYLSSISAETARLYQGCKEGGQGLLIIDLSIQSAPVSAIDHYV